MEKKIKILTWLLAISLVLNMYSIFRLDKVENIIRFNQNDTRIMDVLRNDINNLYRSINEIKQEGNWIIYKEFEPNQEVSSPEEIHLDLYVLFKELEEDAKILLLYRDINESQDWIEVIADKVDRNHFRAPLVLSPQKQYDYRLIAEGKVIKMDEVNAIPSQYYRPTPLFMGGAGGSSWQGQWHDFQVSFSQNTPILFDFYRIKDVKARIYFGSDFKTFELSPRNIGQHKEWSLEMVPEDLDGDITAVILEIEYEDGSIEEENFTAEVLEMMASMFK